MNASKQLFLSALTGWSLSMPAVAVKFDTLGFGGTLNGWRKNRTAPYCIDHHSSLTYKPTITPNPGGGIFISTRIGHRPTLSKQTTSYLELSYSSEGTLVTAQTRIMAGDNPINTGLLMRPALAPVAAEGEPAPTNPEPWNTGTKVLIRNLFKSLDTEFAKVAKQDLEGKKDVFSRVFGTGYQTADLAAALRHNLNLIMRFTG